MRRHRPAGVARTDPCDIRAFELPAPTGEVIPDDPDDTADDDTGSDDTEGEEIVESGPAVPIVARPA